MKYRIVNGDDLALGLGRVKTLMRGDVFVDGRNL